MTFMIKPGLRLSTYLRRLVNNSTPATARCALCLAPAVAARLCRACEEELPALVACCATCALPLPLPAPACGRCQTRPPAFDRIKAAFLYTFPLNPMITRFKYRGELAMARPLTTLLAERLGQDTGPMPEVLLPCPTHPRRYRTRGFNQAAIIAGMLGNLLDIPVDYRLCQRSRETRPQTGLDRHARLRNLDNAFELTARPPGRVAIVDDVVTTAATAQQLATALKAGGAKDVSVWALARTPPF